MGVRKVSHVLGRWTAVENIRLPEMDLTLSLVGKSMSDTRSLHILTMGILWYSPVPVSTDFPSKNKSHKAKKTILYTNADLIVFQCVSVALLNCWSILSKYLWIKDLAASLSSVNFNHLLGWTMVNLISLKYHEISPPQSLTHSKYSGVFSWDATRLSFWLVQVSPWWRIPVVDCYVLSPHCHTPAGIVRSYSYYGTLYITKI